MGKKDLFTLYGRIKENLREKFLNGKKQMGEQLPTEPFLCKAYSVSRITLRRAVSELCAEGLLEKIAGKGTFVTARKSERRNPKKAIKIILPDNQLFRQILVSAEEFAHRKGYDVIFANIDTADLQDHTERGEENGVSGYILMPSFFGSLKSAANQKTIKALSNLRAKKVPFVLINWVLKKFKFDSVGTDNRLGGFLATQHLIEHGRKNIAYLSFPLNQEDRLRIIGYQEALKKLSKGKIIIKEIRKWEENYGYLEAKELLLQEKPEGIFAFDDMAAAQIFWAARELGLKIPEELALVGCDDCAFSILPIGLTSINQNLPRIAILATKLLLRRADGDWSDFPENMVVKPSLVIRQSCGCRKKETEG